MKRFSVLFFFVLFLMGCSFNGLMSESYNGEKVQTDEEAAELFEDENLLIKDGLESRYAFLNSNTVFEGITEGGVEKTLSPGSYMTGKDIESGRYKAATDSASAIVVYDDQGDRVLETALNYYSTEAVLELQEGYRVDYITRQGEITLMPFAEGYDTVLPAGIHTVGTHLEAGGYTLLTKELPVRRENFEDNIYFNAAGMNSMSLSNPDNEIDRESGIPVTLYKGDTIITEHPLVLEKH